MQYAYAIKHTFLNMNYEGKRFWCSPKLWLPTYDLAVLICQIFLPWISCLLRCTATQIQHLPFLLCKVNYTIAVANRSCTCVI